MDVCAGTDTCFSLPPEDRLVLHLLGWPDVVAQLHGHPRQELWICASPRITHLL